MFIINKIRPEYFFQHDLPTDMGIRNLIIGNDYSTVLYNALRIVEKNLGHINPVKEKPFNWFNLKYRTAVLRNLLLLPWQSHSGFYSFHRPTSYFKSEDRKSTRLNSSHVAISYAVFCLKKKKI